MIPRERGFLLLTSHLGDPERRVLTYPQLRDLAARVAAFPHGDGEGELTESHLRQMGCSQELSSRVLHLLGQEAELDWYLSRGKRQGCIPVSRISADYPRLLRFRLGGETPGCLWCRGDLQLLNTPTVSLVGCRELREENRLFAEEVGRQAALQGLTLVSGNARGADRTAQESCLKAGGRVISMVADELIKWRPRENALYLSEEDFDAPFTTQRAISRNRCIHAMGAMVFVAQANLEKGGSWYGSVQNLRHGWSHVAVFRDGSEAAERLIQMGAIPVSLEDLKDIALLAQPEQNFLI